MRVTVVWINRLLWGFIAFAVVTLGALVAVGRHYIDYLDNYQAQIVEQISRRTGLHLDIEKLDAQWVRLSPQFTLDKLRIFNPQRPDEVVISVDRLVVRVGLFQSLAHLGPVFSLVEGRGARAQFDEQANGRWQLRGFAGGGSADPLIDGLLRIHRAQFKGSTASLRFLDASTAQVDAANVQLLRSGRFRRLQATLSAAQRGEPLRLTVEAKGDPRDRDNFSAQGYAEFKQVDLTPILPLARNYGIDLTHGRIDGAAWLDWQAGGDVAVRGQISVPTLDLAGITGREIPPITQLATSFLWREHAGRSALWIPRVQGRWGDAAIDLHNLYAEYRRGGDLFNLSLEQVALANLHALVQSSRLLPAFEQGILDTLAPRGDMRRLQIELPTQPGQWQRFRLRGEFEKLDLQPWHGAPGVAGFSGYIDTGIAAGDVLLNGRAASLTFPDVYRESIPFDQMQGSLHWRREGDRVFVDSGPIEGVNAAGIASVLLQLNLNIHANDPVPPQMTLMVGMRDSAAQFRHFYIPYTLPASLLSWLDRAIAGARLPRGGFIYRGSLRHGDHANRSVQLALDVRDGRIDYHKDWPALQAVQADLWVDDAHMDVHGYSARMFDQVLLQGFEVTMQPRADVGEWLTVIGTASVQDNDLLRLLRESGVRQHVGDQLDRWQWQGEAIADIELGIPLANTGGVQPDIRIDAALSDGRMVFGDLNLQLEQVDGRVQYRSRPRRGEQQGLYSAGIQGRLFDRRTKIQIATADHNNVDVRVGGKVAVENLRHWLQQPLLDAARGETDYQLHVRLDGAHSVMRAHSDLVGVTFELPEPYRKLPETALPFALEMALTGDRHTEMSVGDWADLTLKWERKPAADRPATGMAGAANAPAVNSAPAANNTGAIAERLHLGSALLRLGRTGSAALEEARLVITGQVPALVFEPWEQWLRGLRATGKSAESGAVDVIPLALSFRDLYLPDLLIKGQQLREVRLSGMHRQMDNQAAWQLRVDADRIKGDIRIPDAADQVITLNIDELYLPAAQAKPEPAQMAVALNAETPQQPQAEPEAETASTLAQFDPASIYAADVKIGQLWRGDENLGDLNFRMRPIAQGVRFDRVTGNLRGIRLQSSAKSPTTLTWQKTADVHTTRFTGRLQVGDIADVLERWDFEKAITSRSGFLDADVHWRGAPDAIALKNLDGEAALGLTDGQFLKASGSASGTLKMVGVFNFANLLRRLQLDFSDLYKEGVSFDRIDAQVALNDGVFNTRKPIEISSPSSRFRLSGRLDFNTEQTNMELVATLPIASNLPWVAALAGGLPAAAGVYLASKLFHEQVDHFSSAVYEIRGSWREPEVKFRRVFDDELPAAENIAPPANVPATKDNPP